VDEAMAATLSGEHDRALYYLRELQSVESRLTTTVVGNARTAGKSWSMIGSGLGMTKQSAWERWRFVGVDHGDAPATLVAEERHLAVVVTLARPGCYPDNPDFGLDLVDYFQRRTGAWADAVGRDPRVDRFLTIMEETARECSQQPNGQRR
jgi:hypothetical protein